MASGLRGTASPLPMPCWASKPNRFPGAGPAPPARQARQPPPASAEALRPGKTTGGHRCRNRTNGSPPHTCCGQYWKGKQTVGVRVHGPEVMEVYGWNDGMGWWGYVLMSISMVVVWGQSSPVLSCWPVSCGLRPRTPASRRLRAGPRTSWPSGSHAGKLTPRNTRTGWLSCAATRAPEFAAPGRRTKGGSRGTL